jgi:hypothetical protein
VSQLRPPSTAGLSRPNNFRISAGPRSAPRTGKARRRLQPEREGSDHLFGLLDTGLCHDARVSTPPAWSEVADTCGADGWASVSGEKAPEHHSSRICWTKARISKRLILRSGKKLLTASVSSSKTSKMASILVIIKSSMLRRRDV